MSTSNMDIAQNYRRSAVPFSKPTVLTVLTEFQSFYRWKNIRDDEKRTALDIGFGDGSVTMEVIKPFLPESTRLDAGDKLEDMIRFAKHCYGEEDCKFFKLDVEGDILDQRLLKSYNHIFAFFLFHFVGNHRKALQNIYDMLKPNGNFIFIFMPNLAHFSALKAMSLNPKYSSYLQEVDTTYPRPFAKEKFPHKIFAELMSECGFRNIVTKADVRHVFFESPDILKGQAQYADQFGKNMPPELREIYFAQYLETIKQVEGFWSEKYKDNGELEGVVEAINVVIGYGEKDSQ